MSELERRAVAVNGWRWMPGMRLRSLRTHLRIVGVNTDGSLRVSWDDPDRPVEGDSFAAGDLSKATPDLTDPATIGCLLVQVSHKARKEREAAILKAQDASPKWEVLRVSPDPNDWKMYQVQEPMPVNDILRQVVKEIEVDGFRQPLRIGGLLLRALEAAE
jgi:hypothetical protein